MSIYNQEKKFYVYSWIRIRNSENGEAGSPFYIGKGYGNRAFDKNHTIKPPKDITRIIFLAENMNEADALQFEMLLIRYYGRIDTNSGCLRNKTDGGQGVSGRILSEDTKKKIAIANSNPSDETRKRMSKINKGRKFSKEFCKKAQVRQTGKKLSSTTKKQISDALMNHSVSIETKNKISKSHTGKPLSNEHRLSLSKSHMGNKLSEETIAKRSAKNRGKICVTNKILKINKRIYPFELHFYELTGFTKGMTKFINMNDEVV
jgi:hypothetical protein